MTISFDAVLFDCDGVLVDSEPITNGVLCRMLGELGWQLSLHECMAVFVGNTVMDKAALVQEKTGFALTPEWLAHFRAERNAALERDLQPVPGIQATVPAVFAALQGRIACASGADRIKVVLQIDKAGLMPYFDGRIFSGQEMPRSKPFPDVYLAAAAALGVDPTRCAVVEDTVTGVTAGVAAGATVFGYSPGGPEHATPQALRAAGATQVFTSMADLPALLAAYDVSASPATTP